ncbi:putative septum site-determining protein MinC [Dissostichus eleginoides]|uniref:Septum site-determining protein MinC n=1 Tax=Dissostichus eleginoides TaxID=100907 RepID=A0AAD9CBN9_DISEL|nr:putative septum site-determining protein MinC [Dissostichus eleginoides]
MSRCLRETKPVRPGGRQPPCSTLSISLISLHWIALMSLSAEEVSGFFHPLQIEVTWRARGEVSEQV